MRAFCDTYEVPLLRKFNTNELKARVEPCILHPEHVLCRGVYFLKKIITYIQKGKNYENQI